MFGRMEPATPTPPRRYRTPPENWALQAAEVGEQVYRQAVDAGRYAGRQVEEQPWAAVIATGLLGIALGFLLGRGSVPEPADSRRATT